jgi:hypothetical protein
MRHAAGRRSVLAGGAAAIGLLCALAGCKQTSGLSKQEIVVHFTTSATTNLQLQQLFDCLKQDPTVAGYDNGDSADN